MVVWSSGLGGKRLVTSVLKGPGPCASLLQLKAAASGTVSVGALASTGTPRLD